ncbi:MAG: DUF2764 family protein [Paludibacter sp.]|nr:DUF2764 family protein [Paludibacter sp.]
MNYYCLIAGLPDLQPEDNKSTLSLIELKNELMDQLSDADAQLLRLLFAKFDNENWLRFLKNKDAALNPLGNLKSEHLNQLLALMQEFEHPQDIRLLSYIHTFYSNVNNEKFLTEGISHEDYLSGLYYEYAMRSKNEFLQAWFEFNLNINNLLTAVTCRKHGFDLKALVLGNNEVAMAIKSSNARDFGLTGIFDQLDPVLRIADDTNLLEREKKIDAIKWNWLDEHTFFHYFSIEKIFAFVLKSEMLDRWKPLSIEKGTQIFREMLVGMKEEVKFEE